MKVEVKPSTFSKKKIRFIKFGKNESYKIKNLLTDIHTHTDNHWLVARYFPPLSNNLNATLQTELNGR